MAQTVQEPHNKIGVGITVSLRGKQGVGKSFFVENFGKLFGDSFVEVDTIESISSHFNSILWNKIVVFGDEAMWGGDKTSRDKVKGLITSDVIIIERKFKDTFSAKNYSGCFLPQMPIGPLQLRREIEGTLFSMCRTSIYGIPSTLE